MNIRSQDIVVLLKLVTQCGNCWTYAKLALDLNLSVSQVHVGIKRLVSSGLVVDWHTPDCDVHDAHLAPSFASVNEFLIHGIKYIFGAHMNGGLTRGFPTGFAAPSLKDLFEFGDGVTAPVWPHANGPIRGIAFPPLHKIAPEAALKDPYLYELLALTDSIRGGRARERSIAAKILTEKLEEYASNF